MDTSETDYIPNPADQSAEQLWLSFVMKEKYDKAWNGEDWVKGECIQSVHQ